MIPSPRLLSSLPETRCPPKNYLAPFPVSSVFQSSWPFREQVSFQSSALCNCQILSIPLVGSCSIFLSRSFSLSFCHSTISLNPPLSLCGYLSTAEFHNPASQFLSVCFLAASLLRLHPPTPLFPSSRFLLVLLPPSSCSSVRGVQEGKKERFQGMGEEGRKESKERKRDGMSEKGRNQKHKNRKEAKESDEEKKDKRKSLCFLQAFLPSFLSSLLFSSLRCFAFWKNFLQTQEGGGKKNNHNNNNDSGTRPPVSLANWWKKNRQTTTAATNKRSAPEDMQSARFRHHRQREREEKRKERAPRSAPKHDHYAALWWTITRMGGGFHHYAQHTFHHYA